VITRTSAVILAFCLTLAVACGSTRAALASRETPPADDSGAGADTYITADQSYGVNAREVIPANALEGVAPSDGNFIVP